MIVYIIMSILTSYLQIMNIINEVHLYFKPIFKLILIAISIIFLDSIFE